jgi:hypothetical protein
MTDAHRAIDSLSTPPSKAGARSDFAFFLSHISRLRRLHDRRNVRSVGLAAWQLASRNGMGKVAGPVGSPVG